MAELGKMQHRFSASFRFKEINTNGNLQDSDLQAEKRLAGASGIQILISNMLGFLSLCSVLIFEIFLIPFLLEGGAKCLSGQKRGQSMMELDEASVDPLELWHSLGYQRVLGMADRNGPLGPTSLLVDVAVLGGDALGWALCHAGRPWRC